MPEKSEDPYLSNFECSDSIGSQATSSIFLPRTARRGLTCRISRKFSLTHELQKNNRVIYVVLFVANAILSEYPSRCSPQISKTLEPAVPRQFLRSIPTAVVSPHFRIIPDIPLSDLSRLSGATLGFDEPRPAAGLNKTAFV